MLKRIRHAWRALRGEAGGPTPEIRHPLRVPPGHFYSAIPDYDYLARHRSKVLARDRDLTGIDLRTSAQLETLRELEPFYADFPFRGQSELPALYHDNTYFPYWDAFVLFAMLRRIRPSRVIEAGSGFSSAVILDVAARPEMPKMDLTFIDPDLSRLRSILDQSPETSKHQLREERVEDVGGELFQQLRKDDVLFIDSSHVLKTGNDVHFLMFDVLPRISPGVYVQIHDIHFPFEYPERWIDERRAWNEAYAVRAFLSFNPQFEIVLFNHYLVERHADVVEDVLPGALERIESTAAKIKTGSLWLRRTDAFA